MSSLVEMASEKILRYPLNLSDSLSGAITDMSFLLTLYLIAPTAILAYKVYMSDDSSLIKGYTETIAVTVTIGLMFLVFGILKKNIATIVVSLVNIIANSIFFIKIMKKRGTR